MPKLSRELYYRSLVQKSYSIRMYVCVYFCIFIDK